MHNEYGRELALVPICQARYPPPTDLLVLLLGEGVHAEDGDELEPPHDVGIAELLKVVPEQDR